MKAATTTKEKTNTMMIKGKNPKVSKRWRPLVINRLVKMPLIQANDNEMKKKNTQKERRRRSIAYHKQRGNKKPIRLSKMHRGHVMNWLWCRWSECKCVCVCIMYGIWGICLPLSSCRVLRDVRLTDDRRTKYIHITKKNTDGYTDEWWDSVLYGSMSPIHFSISSCSYLSFGHDYFSVVDYFSIFFFLLPFFLYVQLINTDFSVKMPHWFQLIKLSLRLLSMNTGNLHVVGVWVGVWSGDTLERFFSLSLPPPAVTAVVPVVVVTHNVYVQYIAQYSARYQYKFVYIVGPQTCVDLMYYVPPNEYSFNELICW